MEFPVKCEVDGLYCRWLASLVLVLGVIFMGGCSSDVKTVRESPPPEPTVNKAMQELAIQHFIEGSLWEQKGELAQAVLEYQEALRYDKDPATYYVLSRVYSGLNKHVAAVEAGREAVQMVPDNVEYRKNLAIVYLTAMQPDSALRQYEEVVRLDSSSVESWFNLARLYQVRSPFKALEILESITNRFGPEWDVLLQTADLSNKLNRFDHAASALEKMVEIDPANQELRRTLGQTYMRAGQNDSALAIFSALHDENPGNLEFLADVGAVHLALKNYPQAESEFGSLLSNDTVNVDAKLRIGEAYFGQIEKDSTIAPQAQMVFERIREQIPQDWRPYWFLGAIGSITHNDSLSARSFRRVTELASWNADAWVYLSSVFLSKNNFSEVAHVLESALKVLPDDFRVNFLLGVAYNRLGKNVEAVSVLEHAHSINPKDVDAISQLALVYDGLKHFNESDSLYEEALRLDPSNHLVLNNYSYSLAERNEQLDRALDMVKKALEAQPKNASYLDTMGWVYFRMERYDEAASYVKRALAEGEANATVYEHLGDIYFKMNDKKAALEQWNIALHLDSENRQLREKVLRGSL